MENSGLKNNWKWIAGAVGVVVLYRLLRKKKVATEQKSSFIGSPFGKRVLFTLTNNTNKAQVVPLFNAYSNIQNPSVGIMPSISEFNRTLTNEPKIVKAIEIKAMGSQAQATKPIQVMCKDASGEFKSSLLYPMVSAYQVAQDMTTVTPNNLILTGVCYINYTLNPHQVVTITVHYDLEPDPKNMVANGKSAQVSKSVVATTPQPTQKLQSSSPMPMPPSKSGIGMGTVLGIAGLTVASVIIAKKMKA